jgi:transketolase
MKVIAPGDPFETEAATEAASRGIGPVFLRLGRAGEPKVHEAMPDWELGKAIVVRSGKDVTLISTGAMLKTTMDAANILEEEGIDARVVSMHTVKPIDRETIFQAVQETRALLTVEEHDQIGGLGSAVAEVLFEMSDCSIPCKRIALPSEFCKYIGDQDYLRKMYGLSVENIVQQTMALIQ